MHDDTLVRRATVGEHAGQHSQGNQLPSRKHQQKIDDSLLEKDHITEERKKLYTKHTTLIVLLLKQYL